MQKSGANVRFAPPVSFKRTVRLADEELVELIFTAMAYDFDLVAEADMCGNTICDRPGLKRT
jgi:hypothetical protein